MELLTGRRDSGVAEKAFNVVLSSTAKDDGLNEVYFIPTAGQKTITRHSGLPLLWQGDVPQSAIASPTRSAQLLVKRWCDVVLALGALLLLAPLLVLVAVSIKLTSRGPVFFRQAREGMSGGVFRALKFRSMKIEEGDDSGMLQTVRNDPRVTSIGQFIRRTSIDELPQLFNVLGGTMSIVGPRPHVANMLAAGVPYRQLVPYYDARLAMRPGITGWAQANGLRGATDAVDVSIARVDHDLAYIQNFSIWLDLKIMLMTIRSEFLTGTGH